MPVGEENVTTQACVTAGAGCELGLCSRTKYSIACKGASLALAAQGPQENNSKALRVAAGVEDSGGCGLVAKHGNGVGRRENKWFRRR